MLKHYDRENLIWGSDLQANEKLFLLALNSFVDANGECYPGLELLARMTGFTERTARNIRDRLKTKGIITTNRRHTDKGWRTSDRYKVDFSAFSSLPEINSTGKQSLPENGAVLPENGGKPTGNSLQSLPETVSRDLSSINYPERSTQLEQSSGERKNFTPTPVPSKSQPVDRMAQIFNPSPFPWVIKAHQHNPVYDQRMLDKVKDYKRKYKQPDGAGECKDWLQDVDINLRMQTPDGEKKTARAWRMWNEVESAQSIPQTEPTKPQGIDYDPNTYLETLRKQMGYPA
jgi:hypothetical protein